MGPSEYWWIPVRRGGAHRHRATSPSNTYQGPREYWRVDGWLYAYIPPTTPTYPHYRGVTTGSSVAPATPVSLGMQYGQPGAHPGYRQVGGGGVGGV